MRRGLKVCKTSRRDLALVMAKGLDGATTVSATMLLAARAGIHVFVTGGTMICHSLTHLKCHAKANFSAKQGNDTGSHCIHVLNIMVNLA